MFKVKLTDQKTPESIVQSPRDDVANSEYSFKTSMSSHFVNVSNNPLIDSDDNHTSKHKDQIRPSNLFYNKLFDGSGKHKRTNDKEKWIWRVKGSSDEKKEHKSFVYASNANKNNAPKGSEPMPTLALTPPITHFYPEKEMFHFHWGRNTSAI
ncbi:hypothetical protein L6452_38646 [Arctium lappa]|uniref:Uncharacterized protein n=1 Tax=Arctium lappa TaxID=4217 RepID=A0ACB8XPP4_ARCLA|nr:hypothetical protein L6452_38646 [Arctium lappa]